MRVVDSINRLNYPAAKQITKFAALASTLASDSGMLVHCYENLTLPDQRPLEIIDYQMPLQASRGDQGVGKVDLFAVLDGTLPCVIELKKTRRDTPLRALLEGLAYCAIVEANAPDIRSEVAEQYGLSASRPTLVVMAPDDYWTWYLDHPRAGRWLSPVRDLVSGLRGALGLEACLVALLDADVEMGLNGRPPRLIGSCRMVSVDEWGYQ